MLSPLRNRAGSRLREPFGKAGLIVAIVALVAALVGGAYAASASRHHKKAVGLNSKQKKEVKTIAKSFQGTGPAGPQGPAGSNGKDGAAGGQGPKGDTGAQGPQGIQGKEGSPWTAGGTLPSGKTETGSWGTGSSAQGTTFSALSFAIPLAAAPKASDVHFLGMGEGETTECPGTESDPKAAKGQVCLYTGFAPAENFFFPSPGLWTAYAEGNPEFGVGPMITKAGISVPIGLVENGEFAWGSWAVTAK